MELSASPPERLARPVSRKRSLTTKLWTPAAVGFIDKLERAIPPIRAWHRFAYQSHFAKLTTYSRLFNGVYDSFEHAQQAIPANKAEGYDNPASTTTLPVSSTLVPSDYPVLFWLKPLLTSRTTLFDLGGYLGISYYSYQSYIQYPNSLQWIIHDVPTVTRAGRDIAATRFSEGLRFSDSTDDMDGAEILLASGSLMYLRESLAGLLGRCARPPAHLLINKVPLYDGPEFVTLQDSGSFVCPYRIFNRDCFLKELSAARYEVIDSWDIAENSCFIPFHPDRSIRSYSGMYLRRKTS